MKKSKQLVVTIKKAGAIAPSAPAAPAAGPSPTALAVMEKAREHGLAVPQDPELVEVLAGLNLDEEVPPQIYLVVAEMMAFVYRLDHEYRQQFRTPDQEG